MKSNILNHFLVKQLLATVCITSSAFAADTTWTSTSNADWHTIGNWSAGIPNTAPSRAVFDSNATVGAVTFAANMNRFDGLLLKAAHTSALSINSTTGTLNFRLSNGTGITIESGAGAFSLGTSGGNIQLVPDSNPVGPITQTFQNDSSNTATLGSKITSVTGGGNNAWTLTFTGSGNWQVDAALNSTPTTGASAIVKDGLGTTTFTAANTYAGATTIKNGTLVLAGGDNRLNSATVLTLGDISNNAGKLVLGSTGLAGVTDGKSNLTVAGLSSVGIGVSSIVGGFSTVSALTINQAGNTTFTGTLGGVGANENNLSLTKSGAGTLTLSGANTYTGTTTISAGTLEIGGSGTLGSGNYAGTISNAGTLRVSTSANQTLGAIISGAGALIKSGTGTLTLNGANSFSGGTTINGGTLAVGASGTVGGNANTITVGVGNSVTLDLLGTAANKTITSGAITINTGGQLTIKRSEFVDTAGATATFTGALSGGGNLIIGSIATAPTGAGHRHRFTSATAFDNFDGAITVQSGANLALFNGTLTSAKSNNLTVDTGGYVSLIGGSTTFVGALNGGGSFTKNTAGDTATLSVASGSFSGAIASNLLSGTGTVALTKTSSATLTLSGPNTYSGLTTINGGVLEATKLINGGGTDSSIGTSSNAATSLVFGAATATLRYTGAAAASTDRGFTLSSGVGGGATIEASGSTSGNTLTFVSTGGSLAYGTVDQTRLLTLGGTNTGNNTFSKTIADNGIAATSLTKANGGKWVLTAANSYSGKTTVSGGNLTLSSTGTLGTTSEVALDSGTLDVSLKGGGYSVAKVTGSGNVIGALTVTTELAIGNSAGTVNFQGLTVGNLSTFEVGGGAGDLANVTDALNLGGTLDLNLLSGESYVANEVYTLFAYNDGQLTGTFSGLDDEEVFSNDVGVWKIDYDALAPGLNGGDTGGANERFVTLTAVPEPAAALLGSLGILALLRRRRN
jgi:fibronectin-binding autotransporter adhesin